MLLGCFNSFDIDIPRYKWNFSELSFDKRLEFFESNWAFFAGFGIDFFI